MVYVLCLRSVGGIMITPNEMWGERCVRHGSSRSRFLDVDVNDFRVALALHLSFQGYSCNVSSVDGGFHRLRFFNSDAPGHPKNTLLLEVFEGRRNNHFKTQAPSRPPRDCC
jgi:hypothetical protein